MNSLATANAIANHLNTGTADMIDVLDPDLANSYTPEQITEQIQKLEKLRIVKIEQIFNDQMERIEEIIAEMNIPGVITVSDLHYHTTSQSTTKTPSKGKIRRTITNRWVDPTNPNNTWAGRGQVAGWLRENMIRDGFDPLDKDVVREYCSANLTQEKVKPESEE